MKVVNKLLYILVAFALLSCGSEKEKVSKEDDMINSYLDKGHTISEQSFNSIRNHLMQAMSADGISGAINYCNVAALPLTDSLSKEFNADIRRTSLKWRNPANEPNSKEREILEEYEQMHNKGETIKQKVIKLNDDKLLYVRPIFAQGLCQNCHGSPGSTLSNENYDVIKKLYPNDKAIEYKSGDLRGMWSIIFNIENKD